MNLFYTTHIDEGYLLLPEEEARHAVQVLRYRQGDALHAVDGHGRYFVATVEETGKKYCRARILEEQADYGKRSFRLHLAIAPTKNISRFEWFLEKATEIGIDLITPLQCEHSERNKLRLDRLERILLAALKQSLKAYLPKLHPLTPFKKFLTNPENAAYPARFIAQAKAGAGAPLRDNYTPQQDVLILIGPEGDFSEAEITLAREQGYQAVSLGPSRLRTETAGIVACHTVNLLSEG